MQHAIRRSQRIAAFPFVLAVAVVLGVAAYAPALMHPSDFEAEEVFFRAASSSPSPWMNHRFDVYRYADGRPADVAAYVHEGRFPWFVSAHWRYALYRPLASALIDVEARLSSRRTAAQLDSFLWHGLALVVAGLLLRRAVPGNVGALALLLFAVHASHEEPVGWIAARHMLVALTTGLLAVYAHLRAREEDTPRWVVCEIACIVAALASSEAGLQPLAYLVAYELVARRDGPGRRALAMAPAVLTTAAYLVAYERAGRGAAVGAYVDPITEPLRFVLGSLPRWFWHVRMMFVPARALGDPATALFLPLVALAWGAFARLSDDARRGARWLMLGALLSITPALGGALALRNTLAASLGGSVVVSAVLLHGWARMRAPGAWLRRIAAGVATFAVVFAWIGVAPVLRSSAERAEARCVTRRFAHSPALADTTQVDVFVLGADAPPGAPFVFAQLGGFVRAAVTGQRSHGWTALWESPGALTLERIDARTLSVGIDDPRPTDVSFYRDVRREPIVRDAQIAQAHVDVRVVDAVDGLPRRFTATFDRSLDDPSIRLVRVHRDTAEPVGIPAIGATVHLENELP